MLLAPALPATGRQIAGIPLPDTNELYHELPDDNRGGRVKPEGSSRALSGTTRMPCCQDRRTQVGRRAPQSGRNRWSRPPFCRIDEHSLEESQHTHSLIHHAVDRKSKHSWRGAYTQHTRRPLVQRPHECHRISRTYQSQV
jgi:hypothetical protein